MEERMGQGARYPTEGLPGRIGPYEILAELGRGGMGVVYSALDPRLERRVAIKLLSQHLSRNTEWNARFTREARLLASLNHPNVATIYSLERAGDLEYLTMELIPGQSLQELIRAGSLTLPDALSIGRQIARALEAAHGAGVVHRDLKPLNVMVTPDSHAKVLDFGLATRSSPGDAAPVRTGGSSMPKGEPAPSAPPVPDDATAEVSPVELEAVSGSDPSSRRLSASTGAGTPGYMSPEQIRGEDLDPRTDLWSFACVLYESLSGKKAFAGSTRLERMRETLRGDPDLSGLPPSTPESVRALIVSCLRSDRGSRPKDASTVRQVLELALSQRSWEGGSADPGAGERLASGASLPRHNLPNELSPLVGRARELAQVHALLGQDRLVTLTGVGGGGKTRLALRVASESLARYGDGVWMAELAPLADGDDVPRTVAKALGVTEAPGRTLTEMLAAHVANRSLLLVLDNCEHVVDAVARLASALLATSTRLSILSTSREVLGLQGETVFQVPPLEVEAGGGRQFEVLAASAAVQLFAQRAAQVRSDFTLRPENIDDVAEICRKVEGIPLAIELAAARTKVLPLSEIARRLDDRFRLLRSTSRSAVAHHQTLESLIDWSHSHLTAKEQSLFRRLSVFRGGWTLEAAEAICADDELEAWEIIDVLARLIDKSLVVFSAARGPGAGGGSGEHLRTEPRYRMLETVREYSQHRFLESGDADAVGRRFEGYFISLAEQAGPHLVGPLQSEWLERLDAEIDNLRSAIARTSAGTDPSAALRITGQMLRYWLIRGQWREGRAALERAIAMPGADAAQAPLGIALNGLGSCCYQLHDFEPAVRHYRRAVTTFRESGDLSRISAPLLNLGNVHRSRGELDQAAECLSESLTYLQPGDTWMTAAANANLGNIDLLQGRFDEARTRYELALEIHRGLGDRVHQGLMLMNLGLIAYRQGRLPEARGLFEECLQITADTGDRNVGATAQANYGITLLTMGAEAEATRAFAAALRIVRETGYLESMAASLEGLSQVARQRGDAARSVRLAAAAERIRTSNTLPRDAIDQAMWESENRAYAAEVGEDLHSRLWAEGLALEREAALSLALELSEASGGE